MSRLLKKINLLRMSYKGILIRNTNLKRLRTHVLVNLILLSRPPFVLCTLNTFRCQLIKNNRLLINRQKRLQNKDAI